VVANLTGATILLIVREAYRESLQEIDTLLIEMTRLVGRAMTLATQALLDADLSAAEQVISEDIRLDTINAEIDDRATQLVALQQPVAGELRRLLSALRIASSLERMGDLATHIAKTTRLRYPDSVVPVELRGVIADMGAVAQRIVHQTGAAMASHSVELAQRAVVTDEEMDRLHREMFNIMLSPAWDHGVEAAVDLTLVSRFYERFADHAVTINKRIMHIVTGEPYSRTTP
jgi:phosphate transport system protein